jgi:aspartate aminotransferase-like enzyme
MTQMLNFESARFDTRSKELQGRIDKLADTASTQINRVDEHDKIIAVFQKEKLVNIQHLDTLTGVVNDFAAKCDIYQSEIKELT